MRDDSLEVFDTYSDAELFFDFELLEIQRIDGDGGVQRML